jgi:hypothetical protein
VDSNDDETIVEKCKYENERHQPFAKDRKEEISEEHAPENEVSKEYIEYFHDKYYNEEKPHKKPLTEHQALVDEEALEKEVHEESCEEKEEIFEEAQHVEKSDDTFISILPFYEDEVLQTIAHHAHQNG